MNLDDPILTTYALGEPLDAEQLRAMEQFLEESAQARAFVEETRAFAGMLGAEFRAELAEEKITPMPTVAPAAPRRFPWALAAGLGVAASWIIVAVMTPSFTRVSERESASKTAVAPETHRGNVFLEHEPPATPQVAAEGIVAATTSAPSKESPLYPTAGKPTGQQVEDLAASPTLAKAQQQTAIGQMGEFTSSYQNRGEVSEATAQVAVVPSAPISPPMIPPSPEHEKQIGAFTWRGSGAAGSSVKAMEYASTRSRLLREVDRGWQLHPRQYGVPSGESYHALPENAWTETTAEPLSTFSLDVDTASYANVRRLLLQGVLPPTGAVRLEEMVNYFDYADPAPTKGAPLGVTLQSAPAPWAPEHRLVRIAVKAQEVERAQIKGVNLVFLIDTSGSMRAENKLPLVKESLRFLLGQLGADDRVAIVTYAGTSQTALESTPVSEREAILAVIDRLQASGGTNGAGGLEKAYAAARAAFVKEGVNRVILATDGDFNVGLTQNEALESYIASEAKSGVYLTVLGFGMGNYHDERMKLLSTKGAGNYAYIDTLAEAQRVLGQQMRGTLVTVAKDVKVQVEFNPAKVQSYRLMGYENRVMAKEDFNNDQKDAGEIGAGHHVTALYEVIPVGATPKVDPLKYAPAPETPVRRGSESSEWLTVKLRYKAPESETSERLEFPYADAGASLEESPEDLRFAAAVVQYAMLLSRSPNAGAASWESTLALAEGAMGSDPSGYRAEFLKLVSRAHELSGPRSGW